MKSNLQKISQRIAKALETQNEILIIPSSHNQLNQIDIALKRIGIHGDPEWTPCLAKALADGNHQNRKAKWSVLGYFTDHSDMRAAVLVYANNGKLVSGVHNHKCGHKTWLEF